MTLAEAGALTLVMALFAGRFALLRDMGGAHALCPVRRLELCRRADPCGHEGGILLALAGMGLASGSMSDCLGLAVNASMGWPEAHMVAGSVCQILPVALIPVSRQLRRRR